MRTIVTGSGGVLGTYRAALGEAPLFAAGATDLLWLDVLADRLLATDPASGATTITTLPERCGALAPAGDGALVVAAGTRLLRLDAGGRCREIASLPPDAVGRLNDGKADARGRFWSGTASADGAGRSSLYCFAPGAPARAVHGGVSMANGIGFSPDSSELYFVDSLARTLTGFAFDLDGGTLGPPRILLTLPPDHLPDGLCVAADGAIWLAVWGGAHVLRVTPEGRIDGELKLPTSRVTSCAFGGEDYATLFVTTAQEGMTAEEIAADPLAGALFAFDTGSAGLAPNEVRLLPTG